MSPSPFRHPGPVHGQALAGVEDVGLQVVKDLHFLGQLVHRSVDADPVEKLLRPGVFNLSTGYGSGLLNRGGTPSRRCCPPPSPGPLAAGSQAVCAALPALRARWTGSAEN